MKNILILAPHPDDEVLGCGGLISKEAKLNNNVYVAIMTNGNVGAPELFPIEGTERGRKEAKKAHKLLGVKETFFYDFPAPRLDTEASYKINIEIGKLLNKYKIDDLYIPHRGDIHKDHRVIYESALVAARPTGKRHIKRILAYETLSETEWSAPFGDDVFIPNVFIEISEDELKSKISAFECFTEPRIKYAPHSRSASGITHLARYRGATITKYYSEAFSLVREIL
jgi:LmbE family N-acetylglucosaminyl deacetylase